MIKTRLIIYTGITLVFLTAPVSGFAHWNASFAATLGVTLVSAFVLDYIIHRMMNKTVGPSLFFSKMLALVMTVHGLFAGIYRFTSSADSYLKVGEVKVVNFWDAFYFSGVTLFTVGYGDIVPVGDFRFTSIVEIYLGHFLLFTIIAWGLGYFSSRRFSR